MVNSADFAIRLQKILDYYGISATAFSEKINFNRSTISHLLSGRNKPSLEFVMKVLKQFPEVELYWLLNGSGTFPSTTPSQKSKEAPPISSSNSGNGPTSSSEAIKKFSNLKTDSHIDRIVIFYKDGSFTSYQ